MLQSRVDPEDIVQSMFRSFFRKAQNGEFTLRRSGDLWRLLAAMTVNKARGRIEYELAQKRTPREEVPASATLDLFDKDPSPEEAVVLLDELSSLINGLPERDRMILEHRLQGESIEDIATDLELSEFTIRRSLQKTRRALEGRLLGD
jgi:RNA polymerase sigma-70 factor (ECF subfamily)